MKPTCFTTPSKDLRLLTLAIFESLCAVGVAGQDSTSHNTIPSCSVSACAYLAALSDAECLCVVELHRRTRAPKNLWVESDAFAAAHISACHASSRTCSRRHARLHGQPATRTSPPPLSSMPSRHRRSLMPRLDAKLLRTSASRTLREAAALTYPQRSSILALWALRPDAPPRRNTPDPARRDRAIH